MLLPQVVMGNALAKWDILYAIYVADLPLKIRSNLLNNGSLMSHRRRQEKASEF